MSAGLSWRSGGCHCGAVRFEARLADRPVAQACNCSICARTGFVHLIVPESGFRLLAGEGMLTAYQFNTGLARHLFCAVCGIKSFYRPRSNPDGWSVNARCVDGLDLSALVIEPFDGRNWEANGASLAHLSREASA